MTTDDHEANIDDLPSDDEPIVDPESLLDLEFDEEDEDEDDINMDDIDQEGIEIQMSEPNPRNNP